MTDITKFTQQLLIKLRTMPDLPAGTAARIRSALNNSIGPNTTVEELLSKSEQEWLREPDFGKTTLRYLMALLHPLPDATRHVERGAAGFTTEQLTAELRWRGYTVQLTRLSNGHDR
jgi:hypothetical protein